MTAIVTCGHTRSALAAVRALGRHRIPIAVGAMRRPALAQWSALATSTFLTADPQLRPEAFAYELGREVQGRGGATSVLFFHRCCSLRTVAVADTPPPQYCGTVTTTTSGPLCCGTLCAYAMRS